MRKIFVLAAVAMMTAMNGLMLTSCGKDDDNQIIVTPPAKEYFTLWRSTSGRLQGKNQCEALTALQEYVEDVTNPDSKNFIREEDRIATFDMDGTFVGELYPSYFEYNLLEYRALDDATYEAPKDVMETAQEIRDFVRTDELIIKNLKTNKVLQISQEIGKVPVLSFGNSGARPATTSSPCATTSRPSTARASRRPNLHSLQDRPRRPLLPPLHRRRLRVGR